MNYKLELRDTSFNIIEYLENEALNVSWEYSRIGGCGAFSFDLPRKYCDEKHLSGDFNIRIYLKNSTTKIYDLWYQGLIENKQPTVSGLQEVIRVSGHGYVAQLSRQYVDKDYTSQEISVIVKDILDTYITPNTNITYEAADIAATSFTPDSFEFNTDAQRAMQTLADTVGSREWGVDKDRKFFFKARSSAVGFYEYLGKSILNFNEDLSFKDIINRIIIQGGDVAGSPYTKTYNHALSQAKYNIRTKVIQNSSIITDDVSLQFSNSYFAEFADVVRKGNCQFVGKQQRIEETIPIPLIQIISDSIHYGERKYGTFLYSGLIDRQINRITYSINSKNILTMKLDLGYLRPNIAEAIAQLEYQLEQQRSAAL